MAAKLPLAAILIARALQQGQVPGKPVYVFIWRWPNAQAGAGAFWKDGSARVLDEQRWQASLFRLVA